MEFKPGWHLKVKTKQMDISIKKPCHENWSDMTPNQQGAFCNKCVKTVVDFSTQSLEEIRDFFAGKQQEKVCGRFEEQQLTALSFDAFFNRFKRFEFTKRFALIVYFTFGMWLFNTSGAKAQSNAHIKGDVQVEEPQAVKMGSVRATPQQKDSVKTCVKPKPHPTHTKMMGKVSIAPPPAQKQAYKLGVVSTPVDDKKASPAKK